MRVGEDQRPHGPIQRASHRHGVVCETDWKNGLYSRSVIDRESGTRCDPPGRISSKMRITNVDTERVGSILTLGWKGLAQQAPYFAGSCDFVHKETLQR